MEPDFIDLASAVTSAVPFVAHPCTVVASADVARLLRPGRPA
jgi:hypothetical protein